MCLRHIPHRTARKVQMSPPDLTRLCIDTPTGAFELSATGGALIAARWLESDARDDTPLLRTARAQIDAYFKGTRTRFELPWRVTTSAFQHAVCTAMSEIPFGETTTYGALAKRLGVSAQAVGQGCGGNPLPLIIPCHRVLAAQGLGGFSGTHGVETKVWLLRHERAGGLLI